jgi:Bacterial Ig-like domain/Concanavalin A-like lectin/glucanases superfamily/Divergent InlB B-repeat domain
MINIYYLIFIALRLMQNDEPRSGAMKMTPHFLSILSVVPALLLNISLATAAGDGYYSVTETAAQIDSAVGPRTLPTVDFDYASGDEVSIAYTLPWPVTFYGQTYSSITADTNGNIWFTAKDADYSFPLAATGRGPVITAWHQDLTSTLYGGVFIRHKSAPERVVIQWQSETYTEEGSFTPNSFSAVIFPNGNIRFDYQSLTSVTGGDFDSGISRGDGSSFINLTTLFGPVPSLSGRSFWVTPLQLMTAQVTVNGSGRGKVISTPPGIDCGATCRAGFDKGAAITLTAIPDFGNEFGGWSGACAGQEGCSLNMDESRSVTATFAPGPIPLVAITAPTGISATHQPLLQYQVSRGSVVVTIDGVVVTTTSGSLLDSLADGPHVIRVTATDSEGNVGFAESVFSLDTTPPAMIRITPAPGSSDVPIRIPILVRFSKAIDPASVSAEMISLTTQGTAVPGNFTISEDRTTLVYNLRPSLIYGMTYTFTIKAGVRDQLGNIQKNDLVTTFSTPVIDPDLVGYWPMDGDWNDYSSNSNNCWQDGNAGFIPGRQAGTLTGDFVIGTTLNGYVEATAPYIEAAPNTFTISFWARPTETRATTPEESSGESGEVGQRYAIAPVNLFDLGKNGAGVGVSVGTNGISVFERTNNVFSWGYAGHIPSLLVYDLSTALSGWNHIVVVYIDKQPRLYLNGVYAKTGLTSQKPAVYPSAVFGDLERGGGGFSGQLGEIAIYKRALSAQEVKDLYQKTARQTLDITILSPGQDMKYRPGETGRATVTANSSYGVAQLVCTASGAAGGPGLVLSYDPPLFQMVTDFTFQVSPNADQYAPYLLSCAARTSDDGWGTTELALQAADIAPPGVVKTIPLDSASDISATLPITITFNEAMDPASFISRDTFKFQRDDTGEFVPGMYGISSDRTTLIVIPSPALEADTPYTISLAGVRDVAGNMLAAEYLLHFTTLKQTTLTIDGQGTATAPHVVPSGRYGAVTVNNSYITLSGGLSADILSLTQSTLNISSGALNDPGYLTVANGDMTVTGSTVNVSGVTTLSGALNLVDSTLGVTGGLTVGSDMTLNKSTLTIKSTAQVTGTITLRNNSLLTHFAATTSDTARVDITSGTMIIDDTSKIDVNGKGYLGGFQRGMDPFLTREYTNCYGQYHVAAAGENDGSTGRTLGNTTTGGSNGRNGGSHGGVGGIASGGSTSAYGDLINPHDVGSGGSGENYNFFTGICTVAYYHSGGNGGGLVRIKTSNLVLDGTITANGHDATAGGGSGGGILLDVATLSGSGHILARGGNALERSYASGGGGGGGGQIAIISGTMTFPRENIVAAGGQGIVNQPSKNGGAGTIYLKETSPDATDLILANQGMVTSNATPVMGGNYGTVTVNSDSVVSGYYTAGSDMVVINTRLTDNNAINPRGNLLVTNSTLDLSESLNVPGDLISSNSFLNLGRTLRLLGDGSPVRSGTLTLSNSTLNLSGSLTASGDLIATDSKLNASDTITILGSLKSTGSTMTLSNTLNVTGNVNLLGQSLLTHFPATIVSESRLELSVAGAMTIDATSRIDVTGRGYLGAWKTGNGNSGRTVGNSEKGGSYGGSGGSYGGLGGFNPAPTGTNYGGFVGSTYGDPANPDEMGSGGGTILSWNSGSNGGGLVRIKAGSLELNGAIRADGEALGCWGNGGSGGGIRIESGTLSGAGFITSRGGIGGDCGGGGGGRIALSYAAMTLPLGNVAANGGSGTPSGGAGTICLKSVDDGTDHLIVDNRNLDTGEGSTLLLPPGTLNQEALPGIGMNRFGKVSVINKGRLSSRDNFTVTGDVVVDNATLVTNGISANRITLQNTGILNHWPTTLTSESRLELSVAGAMTIDATSKIDVTGRGYLGAWKTGNGNDGRTLGNSGNGGSKGSGGGSYGGLGGVNPGASDSASFVTALYGDSYNPNEPGSGGGTIHSWNAGSNGGGLVRIQAGSLVLNGKISSEGEVSNGWGSNGSGGGVRIVAGTVSGSGALSVNGGGNGFCGGGGGRIAIYCDTMTFPAANITASGGNGNPDGSPGSIVIATNSMPLTVTKTGAGSGAVTSIPSGIICGGACTYPFIINSSVTLSAVAATGSTFSGWSGDCKGIGDCVVTLETAREVLAGFAPIPMATVTVALAGEGNGAVNSFPNDPVAGIACTPNCRATQPVGSLFTLQATPGSFSLFSGWSGCADCGSNRACPVIFDEDKSCTATFSLQSPARIGATYYPSLSAAYAAASSGNLIETQTTTFSGDLFLDRGIAVKLKGGCDAEYGAIPTGMSTVQGNVTIGRGSLLIDRLVIR